MNNVDAEVHHRATARQFLVNAPGALAEDEAAVSRHFHEWAKILVAGSPEFCDYFEGQNGKKRLVIAAHDGDTLTSIGKRYGMTVGQMERVNRRGRTDNIVGGERIIVYTDRSKPAPGDTLL